MNTTYAPTDDGWKEIQGCDECPERVLDNRCVAVSPSRTIPIHTNMPPWCPLPEENPDKFMAEGI